MQPSTKFKTVADYFSTLPEPARSRMKILRNAIQQAAPQAEEVISYNMPAFKLNGILVYYAANKEHIGFYPTAAPMVVFKDELAGYKTSKGAVQFPLDKPIPTALVKKIVAFRMQANSTKAKLVK
jgi:uncharacterized protein YdhG (YjbR/CyaY superfamily)